MKLFLLIILFVIVGRLLFLEIKEDNYVDWNFFFKCYELNIYFVFFVQFFFVIEGRDSEDYVEDVVIFFVLVKYGKELLDI